MSNWWEKMAEKYGTDEKQELPYWNGTMVPQRKQQLAAKGLKYTDKLLSLLLAKGYRVVKSSAFTPKGIYNHEHTAAAAGEAPQANNLFFEQNFAAEEFISVYDKYGRYENNFPIYFDGTEQSYQKYAAKSDIFVLEDTSSNKPVGFATFQMIKGGTSEAKEMEEDGFPVADKLIYNDTIAVSAELQGKGVGRLFAEALDSYYVSQFGVQSEYGLCTGAINTNDQNVLAKSFHESQRGYGRWVKGSGLMSKWASRWRQDKIENRGSCINPAFMRNSYRAAARR